MTILAEDTRLAALVKAIINTEVSLAYGLSSSRGNS